MASKEEIYQIQIDHHNELVARWNALHDLHNSQMHDAVEAYNHLQQRRDAAFELLGAYFDLHRHDPKAQELQHKTERLLFWDEIVK